MFEEVSGLDQHTAAREDESGKQAVLHAEHKPGLGQFGNVVFRRGVLPKNAALLNWFLDVERNAAVRPQTIVVRLLDRAGTALMTWTLAGAYPVKLQCEEAGSDSSVRVICIELAFASMGVQHV